MLMLRNMDQNCEPATVNWLLKRLRGALSRAGTAHTYIGFVVGPFPTIFCATGRRGFQIDIEFAMWGDTFEEAMHRFSEVVEVMAKAVERCERLLVRPQARSRRDSSGREPRER